MNLLKITYEDGSFFELDAPKGMPSPSFPGWLDVILFYGQYLRHLQNAEGGLNGMDSAQTGDLVENLG